MKKMYLWSMVIILGLGSIGYILGWIDNGPKKVNVEEIPSRLDE